MASGIAEHHEARRKQYIIDKGAYRTMSKWGPKDDGPDNYYPLPKPHVVPGMADDYPSSEMRKVGSPPCIENSYIPSIDKLCRDGVRNQQLVEYTAKINHRFSSTNYAQQW